MALNLEIPDENGVIGGVAVAPAPETTYDVPDVVAMKDTLKTEITAPEVQKAAINQSVAKNVEELVSINLDSFEDRKQIVNMIETMGDDLMFKSNEKSKMLNVRMGDLSKLGGENGAIANDLLKLETEMKNLDPTGINFDRNGLLGKITNPIKQYFQKYERADSAIENIIESLLKGRKQLEADNITLELEQEALRDLTKKLNAQIEYCVVMDQQIQTKIDDMIAKNEDPEKVKFLQEEILFPLRQKTSDLEQMLAVDQEGVIAMEVLRRNNKELIRGVERAEKVTVSSLRVAVTAAAGLYNQKIVLDKVQRLNTTTNAMIENTAKMLKTNGTQIQKQATDPSINIESLKNAFRDTFDALDDISNYKQAALPQMKAQILEFQLLAEEGEKRIQNLEKARQFSESDINS